MKFDLNGDWGEFREIVATFRNTAFFKKALERAMHEEAYRFQRAVIEGIDSGAPGGKTFAPHSPMTIALRQAGGFGGTKILINTAALRNSVTVRKQGAAKFLVGVFRQSPGGVNLAAVHEFGATIRITDKMRRYLHARLRAAGMAGGGAGGSEGGGEKSMEKDEGVIKIPARPYMGPVYEQMYGDPSDARKRFTARVAELCKYKLGNGTGAPTSTGKGPGASAGAAGGGAAKSPKRSGGGGGPGRDSKGRFVKK